ncbi:hypothetical protein E6P09_17235 (plasmid) [Haloferax mediterranei ATCC 33500]|uniref:DUF8053 domain-containing protein n=1 Tax=Haloferax mediterranei (strain ATCC 33500 / DSM 1411 / JCM 8866 / NBRC 14739 / NCIMB 2177 / R-4) TaxID=523841 RepID=I3RAI6_HALMT|nr:hypothetical protein HFX_6121 [Haloferax mediterranei ATCC 33500]AHZ24652.1 hypothetical protein BM92_17325 [Haloferax mediterranei ATCC 33500]ELZ97424.1 hypothetical protein C439_18918 [Haloferax mediterranei ATCC 33500]QCQ77048.1 hypothetical protein E6P09_17235 [Haloferax mediterranei ATCC 33500]
MVFRKLRSHDGTPLVALDRDDLVLDGVISADEDDHEEQNMHVQRLGKGVYVVRPVGGWPHTTAPRNQAGSGAC